ncbi:MAG: tRNA 2-thiocytidine(32) synthetase TtcA [Gammaproteobacteria bacterium]
MTPLRELARDPRKARYDAGKLQQRLRRLTGRAIGDFNMIGAGDRVMVCLSGGKDSYTLLDMLLRLRERAPVAFDILAVHLDQKQPGYPPEVMRGYLAGLDLEHHVIEQDTYSIVKRVVPEGRTQCGLCSRLRRGILYRFAEAHDVTRIALGHHRDDILETLFLNMFFGSKLKAMPPKLRSDDGRHVVIRPLAYCREDDIARYAAAQPWPIIPCTLCGSQDNLQRVKVKQMLAEWEREQPGRLENVFRSLQSVVPSHLADTGLFDFAALEAGEREAAAAPDWLGD